MLNFSEVPRPMLEILAASLAAFAAGFVDAIAGGGGVITFPTLLMLNLPISQIVGTNKLTSTCGTTIATYTFWRSGKIDRAIVGPSVWFTVIGSFIGAWLVLEVPNSFLKPLASVLILSLAVYLSVKPSLGEINAYTGLTRRLTVMLCGVALALGFYDGFFGPGTGMFLTYFFVKGLKLDFVRAAGNTKALNLVSNVVPLIYFLSQGSVRFDLGIPMAVANMAGGYLGARSAIHAGPKLVRLISIAMALLLSGKLAFDFFT